MQAIDEQHLLVAGSESLLFDAACLAELFGGDLFEPGDDPRTSRHGQQLDVGTGDPSDSLEAVLEKQMVRFVVEAPLAESDVGARRLDLFYHLDEVLLLLVGQGLVVFSRCDVDGVLVLEFWWLERAGQDHDLGVLEFLLHLRVREVLVDEQAVDELGVFEGSASLRDDFYQFEVHFSPLEVCNGDDRVFCDFREFLLALRDDLRPKRYHRSLDQVLVVVLLDVESQGDGLQTLASQVAAFVEAAGDVEGMDSLVEEVQSLFDQSTGEHHDSCGSVSNLVVL